MPKLSIIVPVYGVAQYIEQCALSLFEQTLDDLEYIFVDDCSPDNSIEILEKVMENYPQRKKQVTIVRFEKNRGLPYARKIGLSRATGDYIIYCDSDDFVDRHIYENMYKACICGGLDVVIGNIRFVSDMDNSFEWLGGYVGKCYYYTKRDDCINAIMHNKLSCAIWNKMFRRSVCSNDIIWPEENFGEDQSVTLQWFCYCSKIGYVDGFYNYRVRRGSLTTQNSVEKCLERFHNISKNVEDIYSKYRSLQLDKKFQKGLIYIKYNTLYCLLPILDNKKYYKLWHKGVIECSALLLDGSISIKDRYRILRSIIGIFPLPRNRFINMY